MPIQIQTSSGVAYVDKQPEKCPRCHSFIQAIVTYAVHKSTEPPLQVCYRCPNTTCEKVFLGEFADELGPRRGAMQFRFMRTLPTEGLTRAFEESIQNTSANFCLIYNEAYQAEQLGLMQICGVGYRKAFEFLIKDYLKKIDPTNAEVVEKKLLGRCIDEHVKDGNVKQVAKRATWLGNDETHYVRKWVEKDLSDLKKLIDLTLHWIAAEELTAATLKDMPDGKS